MSDHSDIEELFLSDDLKALDEELRSIRYEERPSFGPELRAELARIWAEEPRRRPPAFRYLAAAAIAGLLLVGASVPSARASLVRLLGTFSEEETPIVAVTAPPAEQAAAAAAAVPVEDEPLVEVTPEPEPEPQPTVPETAPTTEMEPVSAARPQLLDRNRAQLLLEDVYPIALQRQGVGGVVGLRIFVDTNGLAVTPQVMTSSGVPELDNAALRAAQLFRFQPAMQGSTPVATWIDMPVTFTPDESGFEMEAPLALPADDPLRLPIVHPDDRWELEEPLDLAALPAWSGSAPSGLSTVEDELADALGDPIVRQSLGPIDAVLSGIAPEGRDPVEWRAAASGVLEDAIELDQGNPAPLLALGRIRLRQGLRTDARILFEQGLQIAVIAVSEASSAVVAELHYERGRLLRDGWLASKDAGRVHAYAFDQAPCPQARTSGGAASGFASVERMMAWNYICPDQATRVLDEGFEPAEHGSADLSLMMGSFRAAIEAEPGHVGANVAFLLTLAEAQRWDEVLAGARRFARHSGGYPDALLFAALAQHELGRLDAAAELFEAGLGRLAPARADAIQDVSFVIDAAHRDEYRRLWGDERRAWEASYWPSQDPNPATAVNERRLEHLARSTYALFRYGSVTSDPGEVWVRFGGPKRVHVVDEGAGKLTEFWDYGASGPDITFVRWVASQTMDLTPEGRAYVDDLGKIFPPQ